MPHTCHYRGRLVSARHPVPEAAHDYIWSRPGPVYGCNHLLCNACGEVVRQRPGFAVGSGGLAEDARQPDADWAALVSRGLLVSDDEARLYVCGCTWWVEHLDTDLEILAGDVLAGPGPPWTCGGHPELDPGGDLDGVSLANLADVTADALRVGAPTAAPDFTRQYVACWAQRLYHLLAHLPALAETVSRAVADELAAADASVRAAACDFFRRVPAAPGGEQLARVARQHGSALFRGVPNPLAPGQDLDGWLALAVAGRLGRQGADVRLVDAELFAAAKDIALWPGRTPIGLLRQLAATDVDWVADHALEILEGTPTISVLGDLIYVLERPLGSRIVDLTATLGHSGRVDATAYRAFVEDFFDDPTRSDILAR